MELLLNESDAFFAFFALLVTREECGSLISNNMHDKVSHEDSNKKINKLP